jgi:hypothetical protein
LQQGALLATTNSESKLVFSNGDAMSAADQMKRMGVMKPVEGGSFRLASALTPEAADKVTGNEFGLGKDAQDAVAKIEKIIQSLESATQSSQNSESNSAQGLGKNSAFKSNADPLASPAAGAPPKVDHTSDGDSIKFTGTGNYLLTGAKEISIPNVKLVSSPDPVPLSSVEIKSLMNKEVVKLQAITTDIATDITVNLEPKGDIHNTLVLPNAPNVSYIKLTNITSNAVSVPNFKIEGIDYTQQIGKVFDVQGLSQISIDLSWSSQLASSELIGKPFQTVVAYFDNSGKEIGSSTIEFFYGQNGIKINSNSSTESALFPRSITVSKLSYP